MKLYVAVKFCNIFFLPFIRLYVAVRLGYIFFFLHYKDTGQRKSRKLTNIELLCLLK